MVVCVWLCLYHILQPLATCATLTAHRKTKQQTNKTKQLPALGLLRFMLTALSGGGRAVTVNEASAVELRCLDGLQWRLGPFYAPAP
jgi:hypothetical protein